MTTAFFSNLPFLLERVYGAGRREQIERLATVYPEVIGLENFAEHLPHLRDLEVIFSTWGMPALEPEQIEALPRLRAIFYAAGTVQYFARPFLERGVQVSSAWAANGVPVAQFALAQILLALKGYFHAERAGRAPATREDYHNQHWGAFEATVSILGAGMIGNMVIDLLRPHNLTVLVFDPFLAEEEARRLGVQKVGLAEAFERGMVVSNHIADLPETRGLITRDLFEKLPEWATFINTGRGATLDEEGLLDVMAARPDLTALLDVTFPEPPLPESRIYPLENVVLTPHIAGSSGHEVVRMADYMIEEYRRFRAGQPLRYGVTLEQLKTMA
jgi:phosphoglycerate dehydrogenase-like enzyme